MPKNKNLYILIALIAAVAALGIYLAFTLLSKPTAKPTDDRPLTAAEINKLAGSTTTVQAPAAADSAPILTAAQINLLAGSTTTNIPTVGIGPQYNPDYSPAANLVFNDPNPTALSVGI